MLKPAYLLGALALLAAGAGVALQGDPKPVTVAVATPTPVPTTAAPVQVSPSPAPRSTTPVVQVEFRDRLYLGGKVPAVSCPLPTGALDTKAALLTYGRAMNDCLFRGWSPVVSRAGGSLGPVSFAAFEKGMTSPCGVPDSAYSAFYCGTNRTVYFVWKEFLEKEYDDRVEAQMAMIDTLVHEFGHHLQFVFAIDAYYAGRYAESHGDPTLVESRRMELQATCFGAAFTGANRASLRLRGERLADLQYYQRSGDYNDESRVHGSDKSNAYWTRRAFKSANPGSCNTWKVPAKLVA